jgi:uncharacterized protein
MSSTPQHEPTMEEILASIRKIISEDAPESANETAPTAVPAAAIEADVLELTQEVEHAPVAEPAHVPRNENDIVFQTIEETAVRNNSPSDTDNSIFSDHTRRALDDAFNNIPAESAPEQPAYRPAAPLAPVDGATVENVFERAVRESFDPVLHQYLSSNAEAVIERMKPIIREWMDEHFPALLEGVVRAEVERVVKARGARR